MLYAFSFFFSPVYILNYYYSSVSLTDLYSPLMHLSQERNLYWILLFSLKNEDFCTLTSAISSPPFQKDTTFYLYYIANVERVYTYDFLFNSSSNSSTCCNVSPFIKEKSVVSSLPSLKKSLS